MGEILPLIKKLIIHFKIPYYTAIGRFKSRSLQNLLLNIFGVLFFPLCGKGPGNN